MASESGNSINQKQGVINKCPSCGGVLKAFVTTCELCGHELAGVAANRTVTLLADKFNAIESEVDRAGLAGGKREREIIARKARVIRDFPVPNSREDLQSLIYFIHPKIQNNLKPDPNAEDWRVKFTEVMTLAKNAYKGDAKVRSEFEEIERSLNSTLSGNIKTSAKRSPIMAASVGLVVMIAVVGLANVQMEKWNAKKCEEKYAQGAAIEKSRLEGVVTAVLAKQKEKSYVDALTKVNQLHWEYKESCKPDALKSDQDQWEVKRKEMTALLQQSESNEAAEAKAKQDREEADKQAQLEREAAEKKAQVDQAAAEALNKKAKQMGAERKAATNKEW